MNAQTQTPVQINRPNRSKSMDYYVIVSAHNLAELQACLYLQPERIFLICSESMTHYAKSFIGVLRHLLPAAFIQIIGPLGDAGQLLKGQQMAEIHEWIRLNLMSRLKEARQQGYLQLLNMTGGTKPMSLALSNLDHSDGLAWDELHYQNMPSNDYPSQIERFHIHKMDFRPLGTYDLSKVQVCPKLALELYISNFKLDKRLSWQSSALAIELAVERLAAQTLLKTTGKPHFDHPWSYLTPALEYHWFVEDHKNKDFFNLNWESEKFPLPRAQVMPLLERLLTLDPQLQPLQFTYEGVVFPTQANKACKNWCKWISGHWYEELVMEWLSQCGVEAGSYVPNVHITTANGSETHEMDILLLRNNKFHVIEIKADLPEGKKLTEFEQGITSASSRLGHAQKYLVLAPHLKPAGLEDEKSQNPEVQRWRVFNDRCKLLGITIITAASADDIRVGLKLVDVQQVPNTAQHLNSDTASQACET